VEQGIIEQAIGFTQEMPGGYVFEIGNGWISRRIYCIAGRIGTTSLINGLNGEEYLDETVAEFEITLTGEDKRAVLNFKDFRLTGYSTPNWDDNIRTLQLDLAADIGEKTLAISVFYEARAGESFMRKWIRIEPCELEGWVVRQVIIENMKFREMVEGVIPQPRYPRKCQNHEDKVHSEPENVNAEEPERRLMFGDLARSVVTYWGYGEGLFFFTESLTGDEMFYRPTGLVMKQREFAPLSEGITTGSAIIGAYSGAPELGFKRYNEYLLKNWCVVDDKRIPVAWNTWLITFEDGTPLFGNYTRDFLMDTIERLKDAGFYEVLHLDLGWEGDYPLAVDKGKFFDELHDVVKRAKGAADLDMMYWVNPFSQSYWRSRLEVEHPEYTAPGKVSGRSNATALCVMTEYSDYVKQRFIDLATELNARVIYWDGNDWNIPECSSKAHDHWDQEELEVMATKRLTEICRAAHDARPDLIIAAFSLPISNHRLCALDAQCVSDTHSFPTGQSELIQRQQIYQMTFEHPYRTIWGSWYGVNWHEAGEKNLSERPMRELVHAEMSMIGNGLAQSGGSIDLEHARPEFIEFLRKLFAFRKRFEKYFAVYQHVLGFPDGKHVDGEGHIIDGAGFIVLVNPTDEERTVKIPLDEVELELPAGKKHTLSDWSSLEEGRRMGSATIDKAPEIDLAPLEVRYVGVNVE